jgi:hypothetical protein
MNQLQLNVDELKGFIKHMVSNNQHIQEDGKVPVAVNIEGEAGLGKTSAIMQLGSELDMQVVKLNLAQLEELGDLVGFPVKEFQVKNNEGKSLWITEQEIDTANKKGYKVVDKRMSHAAPEWIQGRGEGGFLVLDDYTRADHRFMQACMELIDKQEYVSWRLPRNWHVILTTNPDNGDYNVTSLDNAQKTRFISVETKFDANVWARWAENMRIDGRCINFLLMHPEIITQEINPRSITTFFNSISSIKDFSKELPLIQMVGEGSIGPEAASLFVMFINNQLDKILTPQELIQKDEKELLEALDDCVGVNDTYRADIASVLATRLINYCLRTASEGHVPESMINRLIKLTTKFNTFTEDLKYYIVKELLGGHKAKFSKMMLDQNVLQMSTK